jgi:hypothetical protein
VVNEGNGKRAGAALQHLHSMTHFARTKDMLLKKHAGNFCVGEQGTQNGHTYHRTQFKDTFTISFPLLRSLSQSQGSRRGISVQ